MIDSSNSELIEKVRRWLTERRQARYALEAANVEHYIQQAKNIRPHRDRLLDNLLAQAGAHAEEILRIQEKNLESLNRHLARQEKLLLKEARLVRKRRRRDIRRIRSSPRRFEYKQGNPKTLVCMWYADDIDINVVVSTGGVTIVSSVDQGTGRGENTVNIALEAQSNGIDNAWGVVIANFTFVYQSTEDGWLNATSWVYPNGLAKVKVASPSSSPFSCGSARAHALASATLILAQEDPDGELFPLGQSPTETFVNETREWDLGGFPCFGGGVVVPTTPPELATDAVSLSNPTSVPILNSYPVVATVSVVLNVFTNGGEGNSLLDFRTDALDLTIPSVWFIIES